MKSEVITTLNAARVLCHWTISSVHYAARAHCASVQPWHVFTESTKVATGLSHVQALTNIHCKIPHDYGISNLQSVTSVAQTNDLLCVCSHKCYSAPNIKCVINTEATCEGTLFTEQTVLHTPAAVIHFSSARKVIQFKSVEFYRNWRKKTAPCGDPGKQ